MNAIAYVSASPSLLSKKRGVRTYKDESAFETSDLTGLDAVIVDARNGQIEVIKRIIEFLHARGINVPVIFLAKNSGMNVSLGESQNVLLEGREETVEATIKGATGCASTRNMAVQMLLNRLIER